MKQLIRRTRHPVAAGTLIAAVLIASPFAVAGTGDVLREGVRNGTANKETEIIGNMKAQSGKGGFVTRQSNISTGSNAGGGAIYGCRTPVGGTATGTAPCLRASNLAGGNAFEFATSGGPTAGLISVGNPAAPNPGAPFTTNAVGVATGLNADNVDGKSAAQIIAEARAKAGLDADTLDGKDSTDLVMKSDRLWAVIDAAHTGIVRSSGGVTFAEGTADNGRVDITFPRDISGCAYIAGVSAPDASGPTPLGHAVVDGRFGTSTLRITTFENDATVAPFTEFPFQVIVTC